MRERTHRRRRHPNPPPPPPPRRFPPHPNAMDVKKGYDQSTPNRTKPVAHHHPGMMTTHCIPYHNRATHSKHISHTNPTDTYLMVPRVVRVGQIVELLLGRPAGGALEP